MMKEFLLILVLNSILIANLVEGLDYLHLIQHYEVIEPLHIGEHARHKRDLSTKYHDTNTHLDETKFQIRGLTKDFVIEITKNTVLLPKSYRLIHQGSSPTVPIENCYYHGKIAGKEESNVVLSTCNGLSGLIEDDDGESYFVEPTKNGEHIIFNMKDLKNERKTTCGLNHTDEEHHFLHTKHTIDTLKTHLRRRRSAERKYIEMIAVVDNRRFYQLGGLKQSQDRAVSLMNYVDMVYKTMNTRVALTNVIVWDEGDIITISMDAGDVLRQFKSYTADVLHKQMKLYPDNAQLITGQNFKGSLVGLAGIGVICSLTSCAINYDHTNNAKVSANTIAHELGHNLGFYHNNDACKCPKTPCVMNAIAPHSQVQSFTDCTSKKYQQLEDGGEYPCLFDYPDKLYSKAECGNGYLEAGEACDCGTEEDCKATGADKCCDFKTCRLHSSAKCADGPCCENCQFKSQGALCRKKMHSECDLEEFCSGKSAECPRNFYVQDGGECASGQGVCYQGLCKTHTAQCQTLWGENAMKAPDVCFSSNKDGDQYGNCGKNERDKEVKCAQKDVLCGKIQCQAQSGKSLPEYPLLGTGKSVSIKYIGGVQCRVASATFHPELTDPTITAEGTKCAQDSICFENVCKNVSSLGTTIPCKSGCRNGGICNNNGNCHCPVGFSCPYCEQAGPGGSLDSGQGCLLQDDCECLTPLVKALLVLFLLVLPLCCFIGFLLFRNKDQLRSRWRVYRQSKHGTGRRQDERTTKARFLGGNETKGNVHMQTGITQAQSPSNPYSTSSSHQITVSKLPPSPQPPSYKKAENPSSGKMRPPPKVPPIGSSSPGKLPQIAAYNQMDAKAADSDRLPRVTVKGGKNNR